MGNNVISQVQILQFFIEASPTCDVKIPPILKKKKKKTKKPPTPPRSLSLPHVLSLSLPLFFSFSKKMSSYTQSVCPYASYLLIKLYLSTKTPEKYYSIPLIHKLHTIQILLFFTNL